MPSSKLCSTSDLETDGSSCEILCGKIGAEDFPLVAPCAFVHVHCRIYNDYFFVNLVQESAPLVYDSCISTTVAQTQATGQSLPDHVIKLC